MTKPNNIFQVEILHSSLDDKTTWMKYLRGKLLLYEFQNVLRSTGNFTLHLNFFGQIFSQYFLWILIIRFRTFFDPFLDSLDGSCVVINILKVRIIGSQVLFFLKVHVSADANEEDISPRYTL